MINPFEQSVPESILERAESFAKELAWLAENGICGMRFYFFSGIAYQKDVQFWGVGDRDALETPKSPPDDFRKRWSELLPSPELLEAFGYFEFIGLQGGLKVINQPGRAAANVYRLTPQAFALLEQPPKAPSVFISYSRDHSTTFALYVEARLRVAGNSNVFVDRSLEPGSLWRDTLKTQIDKCKYFIVLIDEGTLDKTWVQQEIEWARAAGCTIIPVLHDYEEEVIDGKPTRKRGIKKRQLPAELGDFQVIQAYDKTAKGYEAAMNELLNLMGYPTY